MTPTNTPAAALVVALAAFTAKLEACPPCPNCGDPVLPGGRGLGRTFCKTACRDGWNARQKARGAVLAPYLMAWMSTRHAKPGTVEAQVCRDARAEVTAIARTFLLEDREAGRPPAENYAMTLLRPVFPGYEDKPYEARPLSLYADRRRS